MAISRREVLKLGAAWGLSQGLLTRASLAAEPYADAVLVDGEPPLPEAGSFTVAVLPDTQNYSERFPDTFLAQTTWLAQQREPRQIACVLHLGDITNHNTPAEWKNADRAMQALDDQIPYFMVPGNHDYSEGGTCRDRTTRLNNYFPVARFRDRATFGGVYDREPDRMENSFHLFSAGGRDYLVVALEFGPRRDVVRWANDVVDQHPKRQTLLITHAYMYSDDTRYDWEKYGKKQSWNPHNYQVAKATEDDVSDGEELWQGLVSRHENVGLTLNGHVLHDGLARLTTATPAGRDVHQLLVNFQMRPEGGDGWLRLMEFRPDGKTVQIYDYSPTRGQRNESPYNQFALELAQPG